MRSLAQFHPGSEVRERQPYRPTVRRTRCAPAQGKRSLPLCGRKTRRHESSRSNLVVLAFLGVVLKPAVDKRPPVEALGQIGCSLRHSLVTFLGQQESDPLPGGSRRAPPHGHKLRVPASGEAGARSLRAAKLADTKVTRCRAAPGGLSRSENTTTKNKRKRSPHAVRTPLLSLNAP